MGFACGYERRIHLKRVCLRGQGLIFFARTTGEKKSRMVNGVVGIHGGHGIRST